MQGRCLLYCYPSFAVQEADFTTSPGTVLGSFLLTNELHQKREWAHTHGVWLGPHSWWATIQEVAASLECPFPFSLLHRHQCRAFLAAAKEWGTLEVDHCSECAGGTGCQSVATEQNVPNQIWKRSTSTLRFLFSMCWAQGPKKGPYSGQERNPMHQTVWCWMWQQQATLMAGI